jgi:GTP-binding protein
VSRRAPVHRGLRRHIGFFGRRNVGKSTFITARAREKRCIASELPGTTRDAVDVRFERDGDTFVAIDTAGVRKRSQIANAIEFFSHVRAQDSIRRADVVLHLFDAATEISRVDKKLARYVAEHYKPCILVVNKWDLAIDLATEDYVNYIEANLPELDRAPICFVSALQDRHVQSTIDTARALWKQTRTRVPTGELNRVIDELKVQPQLGSGKRGRPRLYFATQVGVSPPTIILFVNSPDNFPRSVRKFVDRFLHDHLPFPEVPINIKYREAAGKGR